MGFREAMMALFSKEGEQQLPAEVKDNPTYRMLVETMGQDRPYYSARNYKTLADIAFSRNIYVFRAITLISQACSGVPWRLYQKNSDERIEDHDLLQLLTTPNNERSWAEMIEVAIAFWVLSGNSYINAVYVGKNKRPKELWALPPDRMAVIPDVHGIKAYEYTVNGKIRIFPSDEIM